MYHPFVEQLWVVNKQRCPKCRVLAPCTTAVWKVVPNIPDPTLLIYWTCHLRPSGFGTQQTQTFACFVSRVAQAAMWSAPNILRRCDVVMHTVIHITNMQRGSNRPAYCGLRLVFVNDDKRPPGASQGPSRRRWQNNRGRSI
jgi:hypothetical protein